MHSPRVSSWRSAGVTISPTCSTATRRTGSRFSGLYFNTVALGPQSIDLYALYLHENNNARYLPAALGDTDFATLGVRIKSKPGAFAPATPAPDGNTIVDGKSTPPPVEKSRS